MLVWSHVCKGAKTEEVLTQEAAVPEPSESRYWCTSKMRFVVLPSGFLTPARAAAEPPETKVEAPV